LGGGVVQQPPERQVGCKVNILNKKIDYLRSTNFELLIKVKGDSIHDCNFLKSVIFC
jgi:hypothetical protein